jgi:hypothetical protein
LKTSEIDGFVKNEIGHVVKSIQPGIEEALSSKLGGITMDI